MTTVTVPAALVEPDQVADLARRVEALDLDARTEAVLARMCGPVSPRVAALVDRMLPQVPGVPDYEVCLPLPVRVPGAALGDNPLAEAERVDVCGMKFRCCVFCDDTWTCVNPVGHEDDHSDTEPWCWFVDENEPNPMACGAPALPGTRLCAAHTSGDAFAGCALGDVPALQDDATCVEPGCGGLPFEPGSTQCDLCRMESDATAARILAAVAEVTA